MGFKFEGTLFKAGELTPERIAQVAHDGFVEFADEEPEPPYMLLSPVHPTGLQFLQFITLNPRRGYDPLDYDEMALMLSEVPSKAFYMTFTGVTNCGMLERYFRGETIGSWGTPDSRTSIRDLSKGLKKHFGLTFQEFEAWFDAWWYKHSFIDEQPTYESTLFELFPRINGETGRPIQLTPAEWFARREEYAKARGWGA